MTHTSVGFQQDLTPAHGADTALRALEDLLGLSRFFVDAAVRSAYASDQTPRCCEPLGVAFPHSHDELAALVDIAYRCRLPLVPRGAGSGNVGGALPVPGAVVVSFECMTRVLEFSPDERLIVVESGMVTGDIDRIAATQGLFYPPDPGSAEYCRIGGNIAMNAAGPRSLKYGVTRDYVQGLRAVGGDGRELRTGCRTSKGVVGYDLTRLLVGSEGTLALVSEAVLRLAPAPEAVGTLRACYDSAVAACEAVTRVMTQPVVPRVLEFMDAVALQAICQAGAARDLPATARALLIVEADGSRSEVKRQLALLAKALAGPGSIEILQAHDDTEIESLWAARRALSSAVKAISPHKINEDIVVPVTRLAQMLAHIEALANRYRLTIVSFGHAGNGNLHVNIMVDRDDAEQMRRAEACLEALLREVLRLGGTLSGEHGIGYEKRRFVALEIAPATLDTMRAIKRLFDPAGILNPAKLLPD